MKTQEQLPPTGTMPLMQHLQELRKRLVRFFLVLFLSVVVCYGFRKELLDLVRQPVEVPLAKYTQSQLVADPTLPGGVQPLESGAYDCRCLPSPVPDQVGPAQQKDIPSASLTPDFPEAAVKNSSSPTKAEEGLTFEKYFNSLFGDLRVLYLAVTGESDAASLLFYGSPEAAQKPKPALEGGIQLICNCSLKEASTATMVFIGLPELFFAQMMVAIYAGLFFSVPYLILEVWGFIGPALYRSEQKIFWLFAIFSYLFFIGGAIFGYFVVMPVGIDFFLSLSQPGEIMPTLAIGEFLSFSLKMFLAFGAIFELPLLVFILSRLGLVTPGMMLKHFRISFVIILIVSALITPPDPFTMMLMAIPLTLLYILSIFVSWIAVDKKKAALRAQGVNPEEFE